MNYRNKQKPEWFRAKRFSRSAQCVMTSVVVLLAVGSLKESSHSCEAAVLEPPSDKEVDQNDSQQGAPKATPQRLPTTATPPLSEYYDKLKKASKQPANRDSPVNDTQSLIKLLESDDEKQRTQALKSLVKAGPKAAESLPKLLEILQQENSYDKTLALQCLAEIGPAAADAVPQLHALLKNKDQHYWFRMHALRALTRIGPEAEVVIPTLIDLLKNPGELVKSYLTGGGSPSAMGLAAPMLHPSDDGRPYFDSRDENIGLAIGGLGAFGAAAARAIPELERVRKDPDMLFVIRESAKKAIERIQAEVDQQQKKSNRRHPKSHPESRKSS